jgi:hypothetical protein
MQQNAGLISQHVSSRVTSTVQDTPNSSALHNPNGLQVWTPESDTH